MLIRRPCPNGWRCLPTDGRAAGNFLPWAEPDSAVTEHSTWERHGSDPTWFTQAGSCYVQCLGSAFTQPRRAVANLIRRMETVGLAWPNRHVWWLRTFFCLTDCLHPTRTAVMDPRWRTSDTLGVARAIYEDRAFERLPILADALMDAGCDDDYILSHCLVGGRHPVECWAWDLFDFGG